MKKMGLILILLVSQQLKAMTLDEYLTEVKRKNSLYSSYEASMHAADEKREAGDIVLEPQLTATYGKTVDKTVPSSLGEKRETTDLTLGLSKKFSTGTLFTVSAKTDQYYNPQATPPTDDYSTGLLTLGLQQSLWKDFFGAGTRIRHRREESVSQLEKMLAEFNKRAFLVTAESNFWDYIVALEDLNLKKSNFDRAKKLDSWTSTRLSNGIGDRSDLMNIKALLSIRELELATASDELKTQEVKIRQNLDLKTSEATPELKANLVETRPYVSSLMQAKNMVKIDSYLSSLEADVKTHVSEEVNDSLKPDLALIGSYTTSSYGTDYEETKNNISKSDYPKTFIGVSLTWLIDTGAKSSQRASASKEALAARLVAEKNLQVGRDAWKEHLRKYEVAKENVKILEKISTYQKNRAKSEQDKFSKGRAITINVVTAETDSAEAEVSYLKAKSGLRKLEAATQLFAPIDGAL